MILRDRILAVAATLPQPFTSKQLVAAIPDVEIGNIRNMLQHLVRVGAVRKHYKSAVSLAANAYSLKTMPESAPQLSRIEQAYREFRAGLNLRPSSFDFDATREDAV